MSLNYGTWTKCKVVSYMYVKKNYFICCLIRIVYLYNWSSFGPNWFLLCSDFEMFLIQSQSHESEVSNCRIPCRRGLFYKDIVRSSLHFTFINWDTVMKGLHWQNLWCFLITQSHHTSWHLKFSAIIFSCLS